MITGSGFVFSENINNLVVGALTVLAAIVPIIPQLIRQSDYQNIFYEYRGGGRVLIHKLTIIYKFVGFMLYMFWSLPILRGIVRSLLSSKDLDIRHIDSVIIYATFLIIILSLVTYTLLYIWFGIVRRASKKKDNTIKIIDSKLNRIFVLALLIIAGVMILILLRDIFPKSYYQFVYLELIAILTIIFTFYLTLERLFDRFLRYKVKDVTIMLDGDKVIKPKRYVGEFHNTMSIIDENDQHIQINIDKIMCVYRSNDEA